MRRTKKNNPTVKSVTSSISFIMFRYILGCFLFIALSVGLIILGVLAIVGQWHNAYLGVLAIAGIFFLIQFLVTIFRKPQIPDYYIPVNRNNCNFDNLFYELDRAGSTIGVPTPDKVYISINAEFAMFASPVIGNLPIGSNKCIVIGLPYLLFLSKEDLRVMLLHEYAHYVNSDLNNEGKMYKIGSFTGYFIKSNLKNINTENVNDIKFVSSLFTSYSIVMFEKIRQAFRSIDLQMECAADDVARKYTSDQMLKQALLKASYVKYIFNYVNWGCWQLYEKNIFVQNKYEVMMDLINLIPQPEIHKFTNQPIMQRINRLQGNTKMDFSLYDEFNKIDKLDLKIDNKTYCSNANFFIWLANNYQVYESCTELL